MLWRLLGIINLCYDLFVNRMVIKLVDKIVWTELQSNLDLCLSSLRYILI